MHTYSIKFLSPFVFLAILVVSTIYLSPAVYFQLFIAFILAYLLNPAVEILERKGITRFFGILLVFFIALLLCGSFTLFLAVSIRSEFSNVQVNLPAYIQHIYGITPPGIKAYLQIETPEKLALYLTGLLQHLRDSAPDLLKPMLLFLQSIFSSTISAILIFTGYLIVPVYLFYLLLDLPKLKIFIVSLIPERFHLLYTEKLAEVDAVLSGFVRGQLSVCAILAVLYSAGLYFIGIDLAIAIGVLAGIAFIIPYLGTLLGICFSVVMALLKFNDLLHPLLCLGWFGLVQLVEGAVITPKIVGNTVGLHPLVAIVALLIGGQVFGIVGMLLAVPSAAVLQVFLRSLTASYRNSEFYRTP
jgi:predicted PurR-regulated permease PerM